MKKQHRDVLDMLKQKEVEGAQVYNILLNSHRGGRLLAPSSGAGEGLAALQVDAE